MPRKEDPGSSCAQHPQYLVSEAIDNFELPETLAQKIAKKSKRLDGAYQISSTRDVAQSKQYRKISASDVLKALEMINLGYLIESLTAEPQGACSSGKSNSNNKGKRQAGDPSVSVGGVETLPPPFTSAPLVHKHFPPGDRDSSTTAPGAGAERSESEDLSAAINRASAATEEAMDVDYDGESGARGDVDGSGGDADMNEEEAEDEQEEEEELEDVVETEAQELREDAMGVEQRGAATEHRG
ncbi:hypothetical protein GYMLUDRAFT_86369 [Collybiopsis luxurians FD-317 M1]|uniref:Transcription factor CBF/NF-Y/archaeal histone domain-containing protein n=1 Tax=Collybiopsis luxurians FD-317 M1 TaxID=944289 RepID=A0A0D0B4M4_9AGAR|nr:hypothetical protein GYMLUDRAFT_86369 [Collybiopsis luxurians FD-317 M1]